jgi:DNA polymerase
LNDIQKLQELYTLQYLGYSYIEENPLDNTPPPSVRTPFTLPEDLHHLKEFVDNCTLCNLAKTRKNIVFGEGNTNANIMFIGEGPGAYEDETGRPFVGRAGELLTKMIENVLMIQRSEVYIANIVKCRPPNNRVPDLEEADTCKPYLFKQIELIQPRLIVALGGTSYRYLTNDNTPISKIRGQKVKYQDKIDMIPTFHPSFLLRNPSKKSEAFIDMKLIKEYV